MINYGHQTISDEDINAVVDVLKSDYLTTGPNVKEFEVKFARYVGAKYAVAVSNGTAALHLACLALNIKPGDEIITTPMTFAASSNCALYCGAVPVFIDVDENGLIDSSCIESKITEKTKAIIPVHYTGLPANMDEIRKIAYKYNISIIEDACHALGAKYKSSIIGDCRYSDMAVFSFHPVKHITTGEGGMITTNSEDLYNRLCMLRTHGILKDDTQYINNNDGPWYHEMQDLGFNYRLSDIQCALGSSQMNRIDSFVSSRINIANRYIEAFKDLNEIDVISSIDNSKSSYHLFVIKVNDSETRLKLFNYLKICGINCQVHYIPVYWHPYYQRLGYNRGLCPRAENLYDRIISIPIYPMLSRKDVEKVIKKITDFVKNQ